MRNSKLNQEEIDLERNVVISELEGGENYPSNILYKNLRSLAFKKHNYKNPIIGWREDLDNIDSKAMKEFYDKYYYPDNSFIVLAGNFDKELALGLIEKHFGHYPARKKAKILKSSEPEQKESRTSVIHYDGQMKLLGMAFHIPEFAHKDMAALNLIDEILFSGTSSRLYKQLVDTGLALSVSGYSEANRDPGLYRVFANIRPDVDIKKVEAIINSELEDIKSNISKEEYKTAQARVESSSIYQRDGVYEEALQIAYFEAISSDWKNYFSWPDKLKNTSIKDIKSVAQKYFKPNNKSTVYLLPEESPESLTSPIEVSSDDKKTIKIASKEQNYGAAVAEPLDPAKLERLLKISEPKYLKKTEYDFDLNVEKLEIDSLKGADILYKEDKNLPLVFITASIFAGSSNDGDKPGISYLSTEMLERGSTKHSKFEISRLLDLYGADINFDASKEHVEIEISSLKKNYKKVFDLFREIILKPAFSEEELEKLKAETIEVIKQQDEYPASVAKRTLHRTIYPKSHLHYSRPTAEKIAAIEAITIKDIKDFYKKHFNANNIRIAAVGDITEAELKQELKKSFGKWNNSKDEVKAPQFVAIQDKEASRQDIKLSSKKQSEIYMGHSCEVTRDHKDYYALMIANFALGGSPLSSRLGTVVRDKHGLVYNIRSGFSSLLTAGPFYITLGTNPQNVDKAVDLTKKAISKFLEEGISETELQATKMFLTGSFAVRNLSSNEEIVDTLAQIQLYGMGIDYPENYSEIINNVSLEQVNAAARKYIKPDLLHTVVVGP